MSGFYGRFTASARDASGAVLQTFVSTQGSFQACGLPVVDTSVVGLIGFAGVPISVSTSASGYGVTVRWYLNGTELPDAVGTTISLVLDPSLDGASLVPVATNACGSVAGGERTLSVVLDGGVLQWRSILRQTSGSYATSYDCGWHCVSASQSRTEAYPIAGAGSTPDSLTGQIVGTQGFNNGNLTFVFDTTERLTADFSGTNYPGNCAPTFICGTASTGIHGVLVAGGTLEVGFPTTLGAWGPVRLELPAGRYTVTTSISGGCYSACQACVCGYNGGCGQSSASVQATFVQPCAADLTGDAIVNGEDLGIVLSAWGVADGKGTGDLTNDGFVNGADLTRVLGFWGACQ